MTLMSFIQAFMQPGFKSLEKQKALGTAQGVTVTAKKIFSTHLPNTSTESVAGNGQVSPEMEGKTEKEMFFPP